MSFAIFRQAVGYSCLPKKKNEDGLVVVVFAKKMADVTSNQQAVVDTFQKLLGNKPNLTVCVDSVRELPSDKTEMVIYIQERSPAGIMSRVAATTLFTYLQSQSTAIKSTFGTVLPVDNIFPKTGLNPEQLKHYLDNPPSGIDPLIWEQAKLDNPNPEVLIPVPMIGFTELHNRLKHQEQQTKLHQSRLNIITEDIGALQKNQTSMVSKIEEYKRRHLELGHRVLQVMVKQEIYRKLGYAIQADEEQLRVQLEAIQAELNAPTQFKGRLNELMSQMRMQHQIGAARQESCYQIDGSVQAEIKQHLKQQQEGLQHLISIIKDDVDDLLLIEHGLTEKKTHPR
ncbi:hypothetical protein NP493_969g00036 [Ridgeia piscesae]|uniref:54 kDa nucleoporin n=1 Tax=Ridgeia piscesae TaxID=27915 RepID=A0AAD9NL73_RIDPI|nr:hypothetical protein NP493_969g00036 [Ridgeia piscesae]